MRGIDKIGMVFLFLFSFVGYAQGPALSPHELKTSYLEKKTKAERSYTKVISADDRKELDRIVTVLGENAPDSYEYHLIKYINGFFDSNQETHLFKAYEKKPDVVEVRREVFGWHALNGNVEKQRELAGKIERTYSKNVLTYYQALLSDPTIQFAVFSGEEDAYPALVLQSLGRVRKGIQIINLDFLRNDAYRKKTEASLGMSSTSFLGNESRFVEKMVKAHPNNLVVSSTVSQDYLKKVANITALTGLSYRFHCQNQQELLNAFWNKARYQLPEQSPYSGNERLLYRNYLPPLLTLYQLKLNADEKDEALRKGILKLAKNVELEQKVITILKAYEEDE